jgi:hypothetical protein
MYATAATTGTSTAALTNGQMLIGSTGTTPVAAPLTGTSGQVTVTNGAGSSTLSIPAAVTGVNSITAAASTDFTVNAGSGGNNSIDLVLPGTGPVKVGASGGTYNTTGLLAIASGSTNANGLYFGTDSYIYRSTTNQINTSGLWQFGSTGKSTINCGGV